MHPAAAISYILGGTDGISNEDARTKSSTRIFVRTREEIAGPVDFARALKSSKGRGEEAKRRRESPPKIRPLKIGSSLARPTVAVGLRFAQQDEKKDFPFRLPFVRPSIVLSRSRGGKHLLQRAQTVGFIFK